MFDVVRRRPQYELEEEDAGDDERFFAPTLSANVTVCTLN
jgi:hypothetical protein